MVRISYQDALEFFLSNCKVKNLSPNTLVYYEDRLTGMLRFFDEKHPGLTPATTTVQHLREHVTSILARQSKSTVNHFICSLKVFFRFLCEEGYIKTSPAEKISKVRAPKTIIQSFSDEQVKALLAAPNMNRFSGVRDHCIMLLMLDTGLRISEVAGLKAADVDWAHGTLLVMGKGSKERIVPFGKSVKRAILGYLERRGDGANEEFVFISQYGDLLWREAVRRNIRKYATAAGVTGVRCSPHTFRHTFARNWITNGGDVFSLQKILGHSSMEMVRNYVNLANADLTTAHLRWSPVDRMAVDLGLTTKNAGRTRLR